MKKLALIFAGLLLMAVTLTSCKKDWTCVCGNINYTIENSTKADAKTACDVYVTGTTICELQ